MILRSVVALVLLALISWAPPAPVTRVGLSSSGSVRLALPPTVRAPQALPATRVLAIAWHHQEHRLSCEAAALRMALSYFGIDTDELTLMGYMGYDLRPARFDARGHLVEWGDPNQKYVGNADGYIERYTGYGVYFAPVGRAAVAAGARVVQAGGGLYGSAVPAAVVYNSVLLGHPVVAWISNTYHRVPLASYTAYDGGRVYYTLTEHAVTVIGVRPGGVLIDDPWFGRAWHSKAQFESAYATFGQMAVILGPA